ncbi:MAG: hypothetical protein P4L99_01090 [Chthoniobacter sp.]|nr:hypothetical protein [Chthoniobacter sp.]
MKTNRLLSLSLAINVALLAGGAFALCQRLEHPAATSSPTAPLAIAPQPKVRETLPSASAPEVRSWQWSDLASSDDATYARNLRAAGCPEETIRDIITAAVGHRYDQERQELAVQLQQGRIDKATMEAGVAQTWQQQNDTIGRLPTSPGVLPGARPVASTSASGGGTPASSGGFASASAGGTSASGGGFASASGAGGANGAINSYGGASHAPVTAMPLAMTDPPASLGLSDAQAAAAARVADNFASTVGSQNLAPTDSAYHRLWRTQQMIADDELKAQIGGPAFLQWQMQNMHLQFQNQGAGGK